MDIVTQEARSRNMAAIRSKNTKPEIYFRKVLFSQGYRYRLNCSTVPGHPDLYLKKYNTAIFIHGCFWHRHEGCNYAYMPKSRVEFWQRKFDANQKRDRVVRNELKAQEIKCLVVWECSLKRMKKEDKFHEWVLNRVVAFLKSQEFYLEI